MCNAPDIPDPVAPVRYAQSKAPTAKDATDAKERAKMRRKRATATLLTQNAGATDTSGGRTLLGG